MQFRLRLACLIVLATVLVVPATLVAQKTPNASAQLHRQANAIRASAEKLFKVQRVPWVTNVFEGFRLAKEENRPVFLYMITGDPLGDC